MSATILVLQTEKFIIRQSPFDKTKLWIERSDGEGTELTVDTLDEWLEKMINEVM